MKILWKENKILCIITTISVLIIISYIITYDMPELIPGIGLWYTLFYDLSLGVLINFLFFIFQLFLPNLKKQKTAFNIAKPKLEWLYFLLSDIILSTDNYVKINDDETLEVPADTKYFIRHNVDANEGWLIRMDFSLEGIERYYNQVVKTLDEITSNISYANNDYELIETLSKLQRNEFLKKLKYAIKKFDSPTKTRYGKIQQEYDELKSIMLYLGHRVHKECLEISESPKESIADMEIKYNQLSDDEKNGIPRRWTTIKE